MNLVAYFLFSQAVLSLILILCGLVYEYFESLRSWSKAQKTKCSNVILSHSYDYFDRW